MRRYIVGLLVIIVVIIFIIIRLLSGGGAPTPKQTVLEDYANSDTTMRFVIESPTQSAKAHREIEIVVGKDNAALTVYKGYDGEEVRSKSYPMSVAAYADFLRGLRLSGHYTSGNSADSMKDERGYCALGDTYVYEIVDPSGNATQHFWSTDCGTKTFQGNAEIVQQMFKNEIPDYDTLTEDVNLNY